MVGSDNACNADMIGPEQPITLMCAWFADSIRTLLSLSWIELDEA